MGSLGLPRVPLQWGVRGPSHGIPLGSQGFPSHGSANRFAAVNKYYGVSWGRHYELLEVIKRYYRHEGRYYGLLRNIPQAITGKNMGHSLELGPEPQMARNGRSNPPRSRRWLEMAARARPGAADGSKWPPEPAPEQQNTRRVPLEPALEPRNARRAPLEPPQNRIILDGCRSSMPWRRRMLDGGRSSLPWSRRACSKSAARKPSLLQFKAHAKT